MVRAQPPGPEDTHHIHKHNLDFDGRHAVEHYLSDIYNHDQRDDLLNDRDNFIEFYNDQHLHVLKSGISGVPKSKTTA